jgi:uncharacterized membrane protein
MTIKNPIEWSGAQLVQAAHVAGTLRRSLHHARDRIHAPEPAVRRIHSSDIDAALRAGWEDFTAYRSDVLFLGLIYAVVGLVLARLAFGMDLLPLLFPLASGFALIGPFAAIGLYEMSLRRERGLGVSWKNALEVIDAPGFGAMLMLGLLLVTLFLAWLGVAWALYRATLGAAPLASPGQFANLVLFTTPGHVLILAGIGIGFLFAVLAMAISVVSFPLLIDRDVGLDTAIKTSVHAVMKNPVPMALWGAIVASALVIGSLPLFMGLVIVIPVLGHATWHLYRRLVAA